MKEITYCFALVEESEIRENLLTRKPLSAAALATRFISNKKIVFTQEVDVSENGLSWNLHFRTTCRNSSLMDFNGLRRYIAIFLADGRVIIVGNEISVPLLKITQHENNIEITADFSSPEPSRPLSVL